MCAAEGAESFGCRAKEVVAAALTLPDKLWHNDRVEHAFIQLASGTSEHRGADWGNRFPLVAALEASGAATEMGPFSKDYRNNLSH